MVVPKWFGSRYSRYKNRKKKGLGFEYVDSNTGFVYSTPYSGSPTKRETSYRNVYGNDSTAFLGTQPKKVKLDKGWKQEIHKVEFFKKSKGD